MGTHQETTKMAAITETHVRMNDYVGIGIYATVTWPGPCSSKTGHVLGLLTPDCVACRMRPTIEYEKNWREHTTPIFNSDHRRGL